MQSGELKFMNKIDLKGNEIQVYATKKTSDKVDDSYSSLTISSNHVKANIHLQGLDLIKELRQLCDNALEALNEKEQTEDEQSKIDS